MARKQHGLMGEHPEGQPDWANLSVLHRSTLSPRASFHNYTSEADALTGDIARAKCQVLSGTWKFHLTNSPFEAPSGFENESFDTSGWSDITVPGMWQLQGFGRGPQYTNVQFPFAVHPPDPPFTNNECGCYVTRFKVAERLRDEQLRLRFEGVDSAFHVWVNGQEIGYSQGARNASEFDITDFVQTKTDNVLAVRVYQYCDGSYIEDQDQWWLSGIFRDVFLLGFSRESRFEDFNVQTVLDDQYHNATLKVQADITGAATVGLKLFDPERKVVTTVTKKTNLSLRSTVEFAITVEEPKKWTAETPHLYDLVLCLDNVSFVWHRVGFRQVELKDGLIQVNGRRVVFKGANRHEHHPRSGRMVPLEFLKHDLRLMKKHNINSIRTCHQPSDPRLYDLADEMGFWIMDEADLECHGFETIADAALSPEQRSIPFFKRQQLTKKEAADWTSDNPVWHDAYLDRVKQLVHRDKLHPSVIIWSLGNEAFFGRNHIAMRKWIKSYDPTRLIHYEPDLDAVYTDMYSRMYPSLGMLINFARDNPEKPLVLCEYIHAMGTGPGNIKEYVDLFYTFPKLQGGWVWEWANHGLLTHTWDGEQYYGYGGDFDDVPNDGHFVMDGVLNSDHTPNSALVEYKKALEPVQVVSSSADQVTIINRLDFVTLDHLLCICSVVDEGDGKKDIGDVVIPAGINPGETAQLELPTQSTAPVGETQIELSFRLKERTSWADAGFELAWLQVPASAAAPIKMPKQTTTSALSFEQNATTLSISAAETQWKVDIVRGQLISWKKGGQELIAAPLEPTFFRAPTDNDAGHDAKDWTDKMLHLASTSTQSIQWRGEEGQVVVIMSQNFAPPALSWQLELESNYTFSADGSLTIRIKGNPHKGQYPTTLPRIGVTLGLSKGFDQVEWFGRGQGESYGDMKLSQRVDTYHSSVSDLWTSPEFPQECSNRTDTRWLNISNGTTSLYAQFFDCAKPDRRQLFDFMASNFDVKDIDAAKHPYELEKRKKDIVILRLDADHHGLGSASSGPPTIEQYRLQTTPFEFGLLLF